MSSFEKLYDIFLIVQLSDVLLIILIIQLPLQGNMSEPQISSNLIFSNSVSDLSWHGT